MVNSNNKYINTRISEEINTSSITKSKKRLHIAMFIDAYVPMRNGTVESTRRFTEGLRSRGHKVTIVTTGNQAPGLVLTKRIYIPYFTKNIIRPLQIDLALPTMKKVARHMRHVDIIHAQLPFYMGWWAARYANIHGIPCVATHHVQAEWISNAGITWKRAITWCYKLFLKTYNRSACLVCPSKMGIDDLARYGYKKKYKIISNGVTDIFKPLSKDDLLPQYKDCFVILSVGRLATEKFCDITMEAVKNSKHVKKIKLVIAGAGPQKKKLQKLAEDFPNKVDFVFLSPEELVTYYNRADLFVHSAETEMEGMSCLEAIACGAVPVIADSPMSASCQFTLDERSRYPFGDTAALTEKIDAWIENPQQLAEMKTLYAQHAQKYNFERSLDSLENLYYEIVEDETDSCNLQTAAEKYSDIDAAATNNFASTKEDEKSKILEEVE